MNTTHPGHRIFIIGAGFSKLAGLPLGAELFSLVRSEIEGWYGNESSLHVDIERYIKYRKTCDGIDIDPAHLDMEEFMSFLDIEHFMELKGSDTWSEEGSATQLLIRKAIGYVLHNRTPTSNKLPQAYLSFAENLSVHDIVITLNYDVILERALDHVGKPYRLFPCRFSEIGRSSNVVDSSREEVTVLKLHGSLDWFDNREFLDIEAEFRELGLGSYKKHCVFSDPEKYKATPIVDGPRSEDDPLNHIFKITDCDNYYQQKKIKQAPFILSPSYVKFVYAETLKSFWHGWGNAGGFNLGLSIIGFSLPEHDDYIRIALYQMISNYQNYNWDEPMLNTFKDNVHLVDFQESEDGRREYLKHYSFVDTSKAEFFFGGFSDEAVDFLFNPSL